MKLVFLSCVLHDIGATGDANGSHRFEVYMADRRCGDSARAPCGSEPDTDRWSAIALHTSLGLAHRFGAVEVVFPIGIGADIVGHQRDSLSSEFADRAHRARHHCGYALAELVARQIHDNPRKAYPMSFPDQMHHLTYPQDTHPTWFQIVDAAGWGDRSSR